MNSRTRLTAVDDLAGQNWFILKLQSWGLPILTSLRIQMMPVCQNNKVLSVGIAISRHSLEGRPALTMSAIAARFDFIMSVD
jgi:hypothetical protein